MYFMFCYYECCIIFIVFFTQLLLLEMNVVDICRFDFFLIAFSSVFIYLLIFLREKECEQRQAEGERETKS